MKSLKKLQAELDLRKLFTRMVQKTGGHEAVFFSEIFRFFGLYRPFSREDIRDLWMRHFQSGAAADLPVYLYIHVPICRKKCSYCKYNRGIYTGETQLDCFEEYIIGEMAAFQDIFNGVPFKSLHFGGGTPNILKPRHLEKIFREMNHRFSFMPGAEKTFECNPYDFSHDLLKVLVGGGIDRISFGVESLDEAVLKRENRGYQKYEMIKKAVEDVRSFPSVKLINVDLLLGLGDDTPQSVARSFERLADLQVDSICIYPLVATPAYLKKNYHSNKDIFDRRIAEHLSVFEGLALKIAEKYGYGFVPMEYSNPDRAAWVFGLKASFRSEERLHYRTDDIQFDCLGLGSGSWGMISKKIFYKNISSLSFLKEHGKTDLSYEGILLDGEWDKIFFIVTRFMPRSRLSTAQYQNKFGSDVMDDFGDLFRDMERIGAVRITKEVIFLNARDHDEKFTHLLFFIDNKKIMAELEKMTL